ncbi:MAG: S8 family serine peptidase [Deltaproteobacteria bacterium]|nr:S8 family serine peptidase [Deltaproteobacteria bacterium]
MLRKLALLLALVSFLGLALAGLAPAFQPNDPLYPQQWGLKAIGMEAAWDLQMGGRQDVTVAVLDNGIACSVKRDYAKRTATYYYHDLANLDTDHSLDFYYWDTFPYYEYSSTYVAHGNVTAGIIGQRTNNDYGAAGIAFNTTLMMEKMLGSVVTPYAYNAPLQAIRYAVDEGADVINASWGTYSEYPGLAEACQYAYDHGVLVVASAGNSDLPFACDPAYFSSTLSVGAVDQNKNKADFSNFPLEDGQFGLMAPGVDIAQTYNPYDPNGYYPVDGTSFAAPMVSGVAALVLSEAKDLGLNLPDKGPARVDWLRNVLCGTAEDLGEAGVDATTGWGMLRADQALAYLQGGGGL